MAKFEIFSCDRYGISFLFPRSFEKIELLIEFSLFEFCNFSQLFDVFAIISLIHISRISGVFMKIPHEFRIFFPKPFDNFRNFSPRQFEKFRGFFLIIRQILQFFYRDHLENFAMLSEIIWRNSLFFPATGCQDSRCFYGTD